MTTLPDFNCYVKAVLSSTGKVIPNGGQVNFPDTVTVRYVVVNDSHTVAGPWTVVGSLYRDGIKVKPLGQPNVVPAQSVTLQPNTVWRHEWVVTEADPGSSIDYVAHISGDVGGSPTKNEEDANNNSGGTTFSFYHQIP